MGQDPDISKAKGKAETYAIKYFYSKFFMIPIVDELDPDRENYNRKPTAEEQRQVNEFLNKHQL
jgi:hypothetical protein